MAYADYQDPWSNDPWAEQAAPPQQAPQPSFTPNMAWTPDELSQATQFGTDWLAQRVAPQWGTTNDYTSSYQALRNMGVSHEDARQTAINNMGWSNLAMKGADAGAPAATATTAAQAAGGGGGAGGASAPGGQATLGSLIQPFTEKAPNPGDYTWKPSQAPGFNAPAYNMPTWDYPNFQAPGAFKAPTGEDAKNEPGYAFRQQQGEQKITNAQAASGLLRGGMALKDLINYNQDYASNEYGNVYNRAAQDYDRNFNDLYQSWQAGAQNKAAQVGTYNTGWQNQLQAAQLQYAPSLASWQADNAAGQRQSELGFDRAQSNWLQDFNIDKWNKTWPYTVLSDQQKIGLQASLGS